MKHSGHKQDQQHNWIQTGPQPTNDGVDGVAPQVSQVCKETGRKGHKTVEGPVGPYPVLEDKASPTLAPASAQASSSLFAS